MKKKLLFCILPIIALVLEILPYGAVCNFASAPNEIHRVTFSYFDLTPFGYANFSPLLTAIVTCAILILLVVSLLIDSPRLMSVIKGLVCAGVVLSLCPLLYGINYFSLVGGSITAALIGELALLFITAKKSNRA